jgi:hypothetical protein
MLPLAAAADAEVRAGSVDAAGRRLQDLDGIRELDATAAAARFGLDLLAREGVVHKHYFPLVAGDD